MYIQFTEFRYHRLPNMGASLFGGLIKLYLIEEPAFEGFFISASRSRLASSVSL